MTQETDYGEEATPSQQALDQQLQGQAQLAAAEHLGRINLARAHVQEVVAEGGDASTARAILGRLDTLLASPEYEDPEEVYREYRQYIRGGVRAPAQASAPSGAAPPAKASQGQPARPAGASPLPAPGSAKERAALLDPNTPITILQQIRARQKGG